MSIDDQTHSVADEVTRRTARTPLRVRLLTPAAAGSFEAESVPPEFYLPSADRVASALLGHWLLRRTPDGWAGGPIVETEAYLHGDPACHAFCGPTRRNRVMWGPPGFAYVYLIYGFHCCVNAVCGVEGVAEAVLIRAIEPAIGVKWMQRQRTVNSDVSLTNGPGKLCQALDIDRELDGANLCSDDSPLVIARPRGLEEFVRSRGGVAVSRRIGITKAAEELLRFYLPSSPSVSRKPAAKAP